MGSSSQSDDAREQVREGLIIEVASVLVLACYHASSTRDPDSVVYVTVCPLIKYTITTLESRIKPLLDYPYTPSKPTYILKPDG